MAKSEELKEKSTPSATPSPSVLPKPTPKGAAFVMMREDEEITRIGLSRAGIELHLPSRNKTVRIRPLGFIALFLLPIAIISLFFFPQARTASGVLLTPFRTMGAFVMNSYASYRAPILKRGILYQDWLKNNWVLKTDGPQEISLKATSAAVGAYAGCYTIRVRLAKTGDAFRLKTPRDKGVNLGDYSTLKFAINGGLIGGQQLHLRAEVDGKIQKTMTLTPLIGKRWEKMHIPLSSLTDKRGKLTGITIFADTPQPIFYLDEIVLE